MFYGRHAWGSVSCCKYHCQSQKGLYDTAHSAVGRPDGGSFSRAAPPHSPGSSWQNGHRWLGPTSRRLAGGGWVFGCGGQVFVLQRAPGRCGSGTNMRILCASCLFNGFTIRVRATANQPATTLKKRAVNLTLNVDLVAQAKTFTGNLSATMETLLADYVAQRQQARLSRQQMADACVEYWNEVLAAESLFADEHSTLYSKRWPSSTYTATKARCTHRCPSLSSSNPHYLTATDDVWWCRFGNAQQHCQNSLQWPALE